MVVTLFVMSQMFYELDAQQCIIRSEDTIRGMMLKGHTFSQEKTEIWLNCLDKCDDDIRCQSFNYVISQDICELNNRTEKARPEDFVPDSDRLYGKRIWKRGIVLWVLIYIFFEWYFYFIKMCPEALFIDPEDCQQRLEFLANLYWLQNCSVLLWQQAQRNHFGLTFLFSVSLGSVPELPAESCAEIRASEGESAVSGKYWLDSNKTGIAVLATCDMSKLGN